MSMLRQWLGWILNKLGLPGFVGDADYRSQKLHAHVRVRRKRLFTIVSVNGLDVYFRRLTGRLDGVGLDPTGGYTPVRARGSTQPHGPDGPARRR
jgi:hypothetical protein